jgi:hypothetical protein
MIIELKSATVTFCKSYKRNVRIIKETDEHNNTLYYVEVSDLGIAYTSGNSYVNTLFSTYEKANEAFNSYLGR